MTTGVKEPTRYGDGADVSDVLVATWGYDQTNASFFEVVKRTSKTVTLQELDSHVVEETGFMQGPSTTSRKPKQVVDHRDRETGEVTYRTVPTFRRKVGFWNGTPSVRITSYMYAHPWDGEKVWTSWYA